MERVELLLETHTDTAFLPPGISCNRFPNVRLDITKALFMEELHYSTSALHNLLCHSYVYWFEMMKK